MSNKVEAKTGPVKHIDLAALETVAGIMDVLAKAHWRIFAQCSEKSEEIKGLIRRMRRQADDVVSLATSGLLTDGGHHKQWYLERIIEAYGTDLAELRAKLAAEGYEWEDGIAP